MLWTTRQNLASPSMHLLLHFDTLCTKCQNEKKIKRTFKIPNLRFSQSKRQTRELVRSFIWTIVNYQPSFIMSMDNILKFGKTPKKGGRITEWLNYFKTNRGRNFTQIAMRTAAVAIPAALCSYQTFFIDYYLDFIRAYR